jgi:phage tail protein X
MIDGVAYCPICAANVKAVVVEDTGMLTTHYVSVFDFYHNEHFFSEANVNRYGSRCRITGDMYLNELMVDGCCPSAYGHITSIGITKAITLAEQDLANFLNVLTDVTSVVWKSGKKPNEYIRYRENICLTIEHGRLAMVTDTMMNLPELPVSVIIKG